MKPYPKEFRERIIQEAQNIGLVKASKLNNISPQSLVNWCKEKDISFKRQALKKSCIVCGKEFTYRIGENRKCCSTKCRGIYAREKRKCLYCGKEFEVIKSKTKKYCSHQCYANSNRKENQLPKRRGSNWNTIRRRFKENPCLCEMCKKVVAKDLHHIIPYKYFKGDFNRANNPSNIIALCQKCHVKSENYIRRVFKIIEYYEKRD